ncbi:unnamed protein product [Cylindrotheca closterium]|uniref:Uncharacterized protein n=1 Tax=Cylindrotheca closterium TaxID=2856 RepID=A0AAD2GBW9_9STRA|nr:unnamed protein product [Cylindrotheca closterium]
MNTPSAKINPELIDQLYGTWTFVSQSEADLGYYKAKAYLVVHFMPDPSQTLGCSKDGCSEFQNQLCQGGGSACVNTETTPVEWSDVAALYQFGFQVDTGAVVKSHFRQGTGDWLGPYNVILAEAPKSNSSGGSTSSLEQQEETAEARRRLGDANGSTDDDGSSTTTTTEKGASSPLYVSRLVQTASSQFLKPPPQGNIISDDLFDEYAGLEAIQNTITTQTSYPLDLSTAEDPYAKQLNTCDNGNLQPVLPRFTIQAGTPKVVHYDDDVDGANTTSTFTTTTTTTSALPRAQSNTLEFSLRYPILSLPFTNKNDNKSDNNNGKSKSNSNPLTKWWPTLQKRLTKPKIVHGPYCYNGALEAYTIDLNFAKQGQDPAWEFVKGCVNGLPCWQPDAPAAAPDHHYPGIPDGTASSLLKWVNLQLGAPGLIALSVLLAMSLICNLRLCCKIKRRRRQSQSQSQSQLQSQGDEEGGAVGAGTTSSSSSSSRDATGNTNMTTPRRQRRQPSRPTAAAATTRQSQQSQSQQPRSAQILTPSRLMKREPTSDEPAAAAAAAASEMHTPLLPKTKKKKMNKNGNNNNNNEKNTHADPSAPLPPPMDRTPASKNPPVSSNIMDRTPIATKVAGPKKKKKTTTTTKEPSKASINTTTSTTSADIGTASTAIPEEGTTTA